MSAFGAVWVGSHRAPVLFRVDPQTNQFESIPVPAQHCGSPMSASSDRLWLTACGSFSSYAFDPVTRTVTQQFPDGGAAVYAGDSKWSVEGWDTPNATLVRNDPQTGAVAARIPLQIPPDENGQDPGSECAGSLWTISPASEVQRTDLATNQGQVIKLTRSAGAHPTVYSTNVACAAGKVWVPNGAGLFRIDPKTNATKLFPIKFTAYTEFGDVAITSNGNDIYWRTSDNSVAKINGNTGKVVKRYPASGGGGGIAIANGSLWVVNSIDGTLWREPL
jgi:streptogramin lyase